MLSADSSATAAPSSLDRHVTFASPPVDTTIPAASYPSSPESTRSPSWHFATPATPNYRTAFQNDPFEGLGKALGDDQALQQAQVNAQSNTGYVQAVPTQVKGQQHDVRDTLSRFAAAPARKQAQDDALLAIAQELPGRKSLDVDAFKRLLLTGEHVPSPAAESTSASIISDSNSHGSDAASTTLSHDESRTSSRTYAQNEADPLARPPPPAPAPRRGKSITVKEKPAISNEESSTLTEPSVERIEKKPPTPPLPRRPGKQAPEATDQDTVPSSSTAWAPAETAKQSTKPPPPPMRRQYSIAQRRPSHDLAPTIEEQEPDIHPSVSSRRSSYERPPAPSSRNSSALSTKRQSLGLPIPPPPPPRRGRGSSRASTDSFRPSLSDILGIDADQEHLVSASDSRSADQQAQRDLTSSNANDILVKLANLQKEVDAARRGGAG